VAFLLVIFEVNRPAGETHLTVSMKFGKTKGTKGLLKLIKFGVATLIFGDIRPPPILRSNRNTAICYVDDTSLRRNARPVMHWLLANAYVSTFSFIAVVQSALVLIELFS